MKKLIVLICTAVLFLMMVTYTCAAKKDTTAPTVTKTDPLDNSMDIMIESPIMVRFSEAIAKGSAFSGISLENNAGEVKFTATISKNILKITPMAVMDYDTVYNLKLPKATVKDLAGNPLAGEYTLTFVTEQKGPEKESALDEGTNYQIVLDAVVKGELSEAKKDSIVNSLKRIGIEANIISAETSGDDGDGAGQEETESSDDTAPEN